MGRAPVEPSPADAQFEEIFDRHRIAPDGVDQGAFDELCAIRQATKPQAVRARRRAEQQRDAERDAFFAEREIAGKRGRQLEDEVSPALERSGASREQARALAPATVLAWESGR